MNTKDFSDILKERILFLDGATGTELIKRGMPSGVCPEKWLLDNPETLKAVAKEYATSGSDIVYVPSFGANSVKLKKYGLENNVYEINKTLAQLTASAVKPDTLIAGNMSPVGKFLKPVGELEFDELVGIYAQQAKGLYDGGVDLFIIETMMDINEVRAAVLAVKSVCSLPVCTTITVEANGKTLTGTDAVTALVTLQSLGAAAVGLNCSTGPDTMLGTIEQMSKYTKVPLIAKPNAGLPKTVDGVTVFDMDSEDFSDISVQFIQYNVRLIGGCCGTSPEYIRQLKEKINADTPINGYANNSDFAITSSRQTVFFATESPVKIGRGIAADEEYYADCALDLIDQGAEMICIATHKEGTDEITNIKNIFESISGMINCPLMIEAASANALDYVLKSYPGRALVSLDCAGNDEERLKMKAVTEQYGALNIENIKGMYEFSII